MHTKICEEQKLIVLFGATGQTGKRLLPLLLKAGYKVRAYIRNPEKIKLTHHGLEIVIGDIQDLNLVKNTIKGAYGVISLVGYPLGNRHYKGGLLLPFIKAVHEAILTQKVDHLLVQSGAVTKTHDENFNLFKSLLLRQVFSRLSGDHGVHRDNDQVLAYLEKWAKDINWVVTRPPALFDNPKETRTVTYMEKMPFPPKISFQSLATYSLEAFRDKRLIHTAKYCGYAK